MSKPASNRAELAAAIVAALLDDLDDRSGLGLDDLDAETQAEVRDAWVEIIVERLDEFGVE